MKHIVCILFTFFILFSGCKNESFFEFERPVQNPWLTLSEFERAPIGSYNRLFGRGGYINSFSAWYCYKNAVADDVSWLTYGDSWGWFRDTNDQKNFLPYVFRNSYEVIASVNDAFSFIEENNGNPYPQTSDFNKKNNLDRIIGELYFLRGFAYYMCATVYCDAYVPGGANDGKQIPLIIKRANGYDEAVRPKIGTVQEIWSHIQSDFEIAYELLPERYMPGMALSYQAGRATKFAAAAMLVRTHFAMGDYNKAKEYADFVIEQNKGDYDLSEDPIEAFNKTTLSRGKEVILWIPNYDQVTNSPDEFMGSFNHLRIGVVNGWTECNMDAATLKRIGWMNNPKQDINISFNNVALRDKRFTQLMAVREPVTVPVAQQMQDRYYMDERVLYTCVFANKNARGADIDTYEARYTNYPIIRLAEMYLTRAICRFKAGDKAGAASDLNIVRKRAWDAGVAGEAYESSSHYVTTDNVTAEMIGDERIIEMYCEGDRIDYLRGLKENVGNGERTFVGIVPYTDKGFVWAIPLNETSLNLSYEK